MTSPADRLEIQSLFPTRLGIGHLTDADLLSDLERSIWMLEEGDDAGTAWCEENGYDGYTSYASLDDLPKRAPAFADLTRHLDTMASAFAADRAWDLADQRLVLDSLWVNILAAGGAHSGHIHPNSVISGTAYITMPDGAGALKLEDPRLTSMMGAPPVIADASEDTARFIYRTPKAGDVLLWESWLRHEVLPNRAEDPRLTISFNYGVEPA